MWSTFRLGLMARRVHQLHDNMCSPIYRVSTNERNAFDCE